jgi:hypothetical protein
MREMTRSPLRGLGAVLCALLLAVTALTACAQSPPDRHAQADRLVEQLRALPGVRSANSDVADSLVQGDVHAWLSVQVADDATADDVAAVAKRYLDDLHTTGYPGYQTELTVHVGRSSFAVESGRDPVTNGDQIIAQVRDWVTLRRQFDGAAIELRSTVAHPADTKPSRNGSHPASVVITLPQPAGYQDVSAAFNSLGAKFPQLADGTWTVNASKAHPAVIASSKRLPTGQELDVWNKLNADQVVPHVVAMTINAPLTAPVWISEKTLSRDTATALRLAGDHLPIVASLPAPVLYTATDKLQAHRNYSGHATGPVAVTIGGCPVREYPLGPAERGLVDVYERCPQRTP